MYLGIDPGLDGALALFDPSANQVPNSVNIPTLELPRNGKSKRIINIAALDAIIKEWKPTITHAFIELVGPMPKQGVSSVWSFSAGFHVPLTLLVSLGIPYTPVTPQVWKKALACPTDEGGVLLRANQLIPASTHRWTPVRGQLRQVAAVGIAEAAMIALWGSTKKF